MLIFIKSVYCRVWYTVVFITLKLYTDVNIPGQVPEGICILHYSKNICIQIVLVSLNFIETKTSLVDKFLATMIREDSITVDILCRIISAEGRGNRIICSSWEHANEPTTAAMRLTNIQRLKPGFCLSYFGNKFIFI